MKGLGAGGRLWELLERQPQMAFNGGSEVGLFSAGVLNSMIWTVRAVFRPPQRVGHCHEMASASEQGEERWGFPRDTSGNDPEMWGLRTWRLHQGQAGSKQAWCQQEHPGGFLDSSFEILTFARGWRKMSKRLYVS